MVTTSCNARARLQFVSVAVALDLLLKLSTAALKHCSLAATPPQKRITRLLRLPARLKFAAKANLIEQCLD